MMADTGLRGTPEWTQQGVSILKADLLPPQVLSLCNQQVFYIHSFILIFDLFQKISIWEGTQAFFLIPRPRPTNNQSTARRLGGALRLLVRSRMVCSAS